MNVSWIFTGLLLVFSAPTVTPQRLENDFKVAVAFVVEDNSAYILPYFLGTLDRLTYSKEKTTLWIRVEQNSKESIEFINSWVNNVRGFYKEIDLNTFQGVDKESSPTEHDDIMLTLRQEALLSANAQDYLLFLEPDILIRDLDLVDDLIDSAIVHRALVVAPLLTVPGKRYTNFWGDISDEGFYADSENYDKIADRLVRGCFYVPLVHSLFMIHVTNQHYSSLSFNNSLYKEQELNKYFHLVGFSRSALEQGGKIMICNNVVYGETSLPSNWVENGDKGRQLYIISALRRLALNLEPVLPSSYLERRRSHLSEDFDMVYIINLKKRKQRRSLMEHVMYELGIDKYIFFEAVDGKLLNDSYLQQLQVNTLPGYQEPFHKRDHLTQGEIGCFLSHYFIWQEAQQKGYNRILILEDDATPTNEMMANYKLMRGDLQKLDDEWDLLYLGRKILDEEKDTAFSDHLVIPGYSYWLVAYALTNRGINKVLSHRPLSKMLPTDEYIPILFDQHPNEEWKKQFSPRDLIALSTNPRLIFPAQYPGDDNYISDTEHIAPTHDEL